MEEGVGPSIELALRVEGEEEGVGVGRLTWQAGKAGVEAN